MASSIGSMDPYETANRVTLKLYWSGKYELADSPEWKICIIKIRTSNEDYVIDALIDLKRSADKIQQLTYKFSDKTNFHASGSISQLYCTVGLAKTIEMSAMAFTTYEDKCPKAAHLPIDIIAWPDFKNGEEYRIRITQNAERLEAHFVKIKHAKQEKEEKTNF